MRERSWADGTIAWSSTASKLSSARIQKDSIPPPVAALSTAVNSATKSKAVLPPRIVESEAVLSTLPFLGHLSYMAVASGFLMTDMLTLRVVLVGGYAGLVAFHTLQRRPLHIPLRWSMVFVVVNAGAAALLAADRYASLTSEDEEELYREHFSMLSRGQFGQLLSLAEREEIPPGTALTVESVPCGSVYFLRRGGAKLYLRDAFASNYDEGIFVNDVAFQQERDARARGVDESIGAYGTVVTSGTCSVLVWEKDDLRELLDGWPEMDKNMRYCLTTHLVKALMQHREAAHLGKDGVNVRWRPSGVGGHMVRRTQSESRIMWDERHR